MNVRGICESKADTTRIINDLGEINSFVYYFQRERIGTGGNLPSQAMRAKATGSYSVSPKVQLNGYVNIASEKNDDLNLYEWERTLLSPGAAITVLPRATCALSGGIAYSMIESNANLCVPVMDG